MTAQIAPEEPPPQEKQAAQGPPHPRVSWAEDLGGDPCGSATTGIGEREKSHRSSVMSTMSKSSARFELSEDVFEDIKQLTRAFYKLPSSVYSSCTLTLFASEGFQVKPFIACQLPQIVLFGINIFLQVSFLSYIEKEIREKDICQDVDTETLLRYMALAIFFSAMLAEFSETINMFMWMYLMKKANTPCTLAVEKGEDGKATQIVSGATFSQKFFFVMFILVPKLGINIAVTYAGAKFVVLSGTNTELVLNSVSMNFVLEIDELMYNQLTPQWLKNVLEELPDVRMEEAGAETLNALDMIFSVWVKGGVCLVGMLVTVNYHQCPE